MTFKFSKLSILIIFIFSFLELTLTADNPSKDGPIVKTHQGSLEGLTLTSRDGKPYYAFRGIPYAEFPGRFEVATNHASWDGTRLAKEFGSVCPQINILKVDSTDTYTGDEMCLFLNVYTPTLETNAKLPVMFWIHGGGFGMGSGNGYDGKYFGNIIVVSINYRLGPLGFLSFDDMGKSSANIGLKDQLLALKWVSKNIQHFGGDASKVTIAGQSAGGASVHFHMLSEQSSGLFRAAISQSGTALAFWAIQQNAKENALKLGKALKCPVPETFDSSIEDTLTCLKLKSAKEVTVAQLKLKEWLIYPVVQFGPVIEQNGKDSFITKHPEWIIENGRYNHVNWIVGITEDEGALLDIPLILNMTLTETLENEWEEKAPFILGYENLPKSEQDAASAKIRDHYFGHYEIEEMTWSSLRNMLTDRYFLEFSGNFSAAYSTYGLEGDNGIVHGDELQYLFPGGDINAPDYSGETPGEIVEFSKKFVKLWASFIQQTEPKVSWQENDRVSWKHYTSVPKKSHASIPSIPFYEIAIKADIWDEDISSRLKVWNNVFSKKINRNSKLDKTEL